MADVTLEFISRQVERGFAEVRADIRMLRAALNDLARENVTAGEVAAIHFELNRLAAQLSELAARVDILQPKP